MNNANIYLKKYFGYDDFRPGQKEIIESILDSYDTLAIMPTGGGKSFCYQIPALMSEGVAIIVSPLISLMKDQVDALTRLEIPACFINSMQSWDEIRNIMNSAVNGYYKMIYIAPERLQSRYFLEFLGKLQISFIAVDEAHCISEWGHDFRPSYRSIAETIRSFKKTPVIALTATATPEVQKDIYQSLKMKEPNIFIKGFDRPNLTYIAEMPKNKAERAAEICKQYKADSVIIYCGSRKKVEETRDKLVKLGLAPIAYHAGMGENIRKNAQERFINSPASIIIATNAFGMGIDKANVRAVIHIDLPGSLEAYYQEAGRAGRDGKDAICVLLYSNADRRLQEYFIKGSFPEKEDILQVYNALYDYVGANIGDMGFRALDKEADHFANVLGMPYIKVNSILQLFEKSNVIKKSATANFANLKVNTSKERIREFYQNTDKITKQTLEAIMRSVGSEVYQESVEIDCKSIKIKFAIKDEDFDASVTKMETLKLISFIPFGETGYYGINAKREANVDAIIDFPRLTLLRNRAYVKLDNMEEYVFTRQCKRNYILDYFGDEQNKAGKKCGRCSSCIGKNGVEKPVKVDTVELEKDIMSLVLDFNGRFGKQFFSDVLSGEENEKIQRYDLKRNRYYRKYAKVGKSAVGRKISEMERAGYLGIDAGKYPLVFLTPEGWQYLRQLNGETPANTNNSKSVSYQTFDDGFNGVMERIASYRKMDNISFAKMKQQIWDNSPNSLDGLLACDGMDNKLAQKFGADIINYFENSKLISKIKDLDEQKEELEEEEIAIFEHLKNRIKPLEIAQIMHTTPGYVARVAERLISMGFDIRTDYLIDNNGKKIIAQNIEKMPNISLRDLREKLDINIDYAELRIIATDLKIKLAKSKVKVKT